MNTQPERIIYPISDDDLITDPIIKALYDHSHIMSSAVRVDPLKGPGIGVSLKTNTATVIHALNQARERRTIEPLNGLLHLALPEDYKGEYNLYKEMVLKPYREHLKELRRELSGNLRFEVQEVDPVLGDMLLAHGKLLFTAKGQFRSYKYDTTEKGDGFVVFEKLPELKAQNLEEAVAELHEPNLIESIVRISSDKPYSVKATILPHFGYQLLGR